MPDSLSLNDSRAKLLSHFSSHAPSEVPSRWAALWDQGDFLPFDRGVPNPALADTLTDRKDILGTATHEADGSKLTNRKKALVPGCGRGYDVLLLASFGYDAWGLEISETAVTRAREEEETNGGTETYAAREEGVGKGKVMFFHGDFFDSTGWIERIGAGDGLEGFDLVYDYTFLSALPPSMRPGWAKQMRSLLGPKGHLVCVEFPTYKDPASGGPPWALPSDVYLAHLRHPGAEIPYDESGRVKIDESKPEASGGFTRVAHWQPERTHEVGKGTDWPLPTGKE